MLRIPPGHGQCETEPGINHWNTLAEKNRSKSSRKKLFTVISAHQCGFIHPGALSKEIAVNALRDPRSANVVCDTVLPSSAFMRIPEDIRSIRIISDDYRHLPYCSIPAVSRPNVSAALGEVSGNGALTKYLGYMRAGSLNSLNLAMQITGAKSKWLSSFGFDLDQVYLSSLLKKAVYDEFVSRIKQREDDFIVVYNRAINEIDNRGSIAELALGELPFWNREGVSEPVPKALLLSIFLRLYICDLYVEGVGGMHYRPAADFIIREFFNEPVPATAAVSSTLWYGGKDMDTLKEDIRTQKNRLRRMRQNPQEFAGESINAHRVKEILKNMEISVPGPDIYMKLKSEKSNLLLQIDDLVESQASEIKQLENNKEQVSREYPFFIYRESDIGIIFNNIGKNTG